MVDQRMYTNFTFSLYSLMSTLSFTVGEGSLSIDSRTQRAGQTSVVA